MTAGARAARVFAGFDGGGTRTTCVLCEPDGSVIGVGSGGPANFHNRGVEDALASLRESFSGAMSAPRRSAAKKREDDPRVEACIGLAGLDSPKDFAIMRRAVASLALGSGGRRRRRTRRSHLVENDWKTAVTGAFIDAPGVVLIAGTGCVAAAQREGEVVRVGGWGLVVDDRGSAYDIGRDALYSAMRDFDGRGPRTALLRTIMKRLRVNEPQGIIQRVYAEGMPASEIASLAVLVSGAASSGDAVARDILEAKGRILGGLVVSAAARLDMLGARFGVSLNGGVFRAGPPLLGPLEETIRASSPLAEIVAPRLPPACGAVLLLLKRAGIAVDSELVGRMKSSLAAVHQA